LRNKDKKIEIFLSNNFFHDAFGHRILSHCYSGGVESVTLGWDKLNHVVAFTVLYILFSLAFNNLSIVLKVLLLFVFGLQIKIVQFFLPPREFSSLDIAADMVGIVIGMVIYPFADRWLNSF